MLASILDGVRSGVSWFDRVEIAATRFLPSTFIENSFAHKNKKSVAVVDLSTSYDVFWR